MSPFGAFCNTYKSPLWIGFQRFCHAKFPHCVLIHDTHCWFESHSIIHTYKLEWTTIENLNFKKCTLWCRFCSTLMCFSLHWLNLYMLEYVCDAICFINEHDILLGLEAWFFKLTFGVVRSHSFFFVTPCYSTTHTHGLQINNIILLCWLIVSGFCMQSWLFIGTECFLTWSCSYSLKARCIPIYLQKEGWIICLHIWIH